MTLGVLGGTFNPVHLAHLRLAEEFREILRLDRVLFVPAGDPPLKHEGVAPGRHRLAMVERAIATHAAFEVCDVELRRSGPSYTVDTLEELRDRHPGERLWFVLGADTLPDLAAWHAPDRLFELASFALATRPGFPDTLDELLPARFTDAFRQTTKGMLHTSGNELRLIPFTQLEISATDIRRRLAAGDSVHYLVPDEVIDYIQKHHLYGSGASGSSGAMDHGGPSR